MPGPAVQTQTPDVALSTRPPGFSCLRSTTETSSWLIVTGELDIATVPALDRALREAAADAPVVLLDLRALDSIDSSGAHLLIAADRRIRREGGRLVVVRGTADVEWFFELVGLDRELEMVGEPPARLRSAKTLAVPA